ncbi:hypothetical protein ACIA6C_27980 [Streptomyces sp. NPDC051578]
MEPVDPITALATVAVQLHEMYAALLEAGFTEDQALELTKAALLVGR